MLDHYLKTVEPVCYQLANLSLHGLASGDSSKPPLLCLHGWLDNAASFIPMLPYLSERQVIAIDWPGHGYSSYRNDHYHFIDWLYDLLQLFELNNWQQVDIVGHSMGGMIATAFAASFPERVQSLTLIDTFGFITERPSNTTEQLRKGLQQRLKSRDANKKFHPDLASAVKARLAASDLTQDNARLIVERGLVRAEQGFVWRADPRLRLASPYRFSTEQAKQLMKDLASPVQLIQASNGLDLVGRGVDYYGKFVNQLVHHHIDGGHHVHMEQPEQVAQIVLSFISAK